MKVCFIGPIKDGTGYSKACIEYILAMDEVGIQVVPRSVKMTNTDGEIPKRIKELEKDNLQNVDIVFSYNLPSEFVRSDKIQNVGGFAYETSNFQNTDWKYNLSLMDKIIVPSTWQKGIMPNPLKENTYVVPHAVDVNKFNYEYIKMDFDLPRNYFKFYTISEYNRRKNIPALLVSYLSSFSSDDEVALVIKTHLSNRDSLATRTILVDTINDLKKGMKRFRNPERYPKIILLYEYMTENQIYSLHSSCDCFVSTSHGEGWCLPALDALGFGKPIIAPKHSAFLDYGEILGTLVDGIESPAFGAVDSIPGVYTSDEKWFNVDIGQFGLEMRNIFDNREKIAEHKDVIDKEKDAIKHKFSRKSIGLRLKEVFEG